MNENRTRRLVMMLALVALGILLLYMVGPQLFDALLAMHGL